MIIKIKNSIFIGSFLLFIFLISNFYFSEENVKSTHKARSFYLDNINSMSKSLPLLKNDTSNIIVYSNDLNNFKKKRKKRFWEKLLTN
tara:strand:+ start:95 stop:358 length:264 start_codon:yes stop_codon:yes gene_type:complete